MRGLLGILLLSAQIGVQEIQPWTTPPPEIQAKASVLREALKETLPSLDEERREELVLQLLQLEEAYEVDALLLFAVAETEHQTSPAVDRRWRYDVQALQEGKDPNAVRIPPVWEDLPSLAIALKEDIEEFTSLPKALTAYFFGASRIRVDQSLSQLEKLRVDRTLHRYRKLVEKQTGEVQLLKASEEPPAEEDLLVRLIWKRFRHLEADKQEEILKRYQEMARLYARWIRYFNPRHDAQQALSLAKKIIYYAEEVGLESALFFAVVAVESRFNPRAVSRRGARGLGQLMPATARELGVRDPFDPDENLRASATYLSQLIRKHGRVLGLAAYNAGEAAVKKYRGIPPYRETRRYVRRVLNLYRKLLGYD